MYHSHYGMQRESGLYGMISASLPVGVSEPFNYDLDRGIILSDWYHRTAYEQSTGLSSIPFEWIDEPQVSSTIHFSLQDFRDYAKYYKFTKLYFCMFYISVTIDKWKRELQLFWLST